MTLDASLSSLRGSASLYSSMRIMVVDDEPMNVFLVEQILKDFGYDNVLGLSDPRKVASLFASEKPDLVLLDMMMPFLDGFDVLKQIQEMSPPDAFIPILILTADVSPETKRRALSCGATDFLTKPFDHLEVVLRIGNLLRARWQHLQLLDQNQALDEKVRQRTAALREAQATVVASMEQLEEAQTEMLGRLAQAAEYRDDETGHHTYRVGEMSGRIARQLGLPDQECEMIERAAPLHDVGKIGIADTILLKPGRLNPEEFAAMQQHTIIGSRLLADGRSDLVHEAERIARCHHERWDGSGYPSGLSGESIPISAQVVSVADVFDALTNPRPYKDAWPLDVAVAEISNQSGRQFNPAVVNAFLNLSPAALAPAEVAHAGTKV